MLICRIPVTFYACRLPIVQGGTFSFLTPTFAILSLPQWTCPTPQGQLFSFGTVCEKWIVLAKPSKISRPSVQTNAQRTPSQLRTENCNKIMIATFVLTHHTFRFKENGNSTVSSPINNDDIWKPRMREVWLTKSTEFPLHLVITLET